MWVLNHKEAWYSWHVQFVICRGKNFNHFPQVMLYSMQFRLQTHSMYRTQMFLWIYKHAWDPQPSLLFLTVSHSTQHSTAHHTPPSVLSLLAAGRPAIFVHTPECCLSPVRCGLPNVWLLCSDWPQQRHGQLWPYSQCHYHKVQIHTGCVVWALDRTSTHTVNCIPVLAATNTQHRCVTLKQYCRHSAVSWTDGFITQSCIKLFFPYYFTIYLTILELSTPCILAVHFFFLFHLNAHNMLNKSISHLLPPTCFSVCYTIFRDTIALFAQELYTFCNVVT